MPLVPPILDDIDFTQLVRMALDRVKQECPEWTDLSAGDPGRVMVELFAFLMEVVVYKINRVPDKAYVEFLNLLGVTLRPPSAAIAWLQFSAAGTLQAPIEIPKGTRVSATQPVAGELPIFVTARTITLDSSVSSNDVEAYHCEVVEESVGYGTGKPGQRVTIRQPPIIAPTGDELDLLVGVEQDATEKLPSERGRESAGKQYRLWREVKNFAEAHDDPYVFVADRMLGIIEFAPAAPASVAQGTQRVPPEGREIRVWYRRGGGPGGNVPPNTLKTLKDPIPGVEVTNRRAATGGSSGETVAEALRRGPRELHSLSRAVTARDFEYIVNQRFGGTIARVRAFTKKEVWHYATPGTVEVLLVPGYLDIKERGSGRVTAGELAVQRSEQTRAKVQAELDEVRPLGTTCLVDWAECKTVSVKATIYMFPEEDEAQVRARVLKRLHEMINPLPTEFRPNGWPFGRALRAFDVYEIIDREPGVSSAGDVRLIVDEAPGKDVVALVSDPFQRNTWYAGAGSRVFRSTTDGNGWEPVADFGSESTTWISASREYPGWIAVCSIAAQSGAPVTVHTSQNCGATWQQSARFEFNVNDLSWSLRDGQPLLLLATAKGLYELAIVAEPVPQPIAVNPATPDVGLWAVATTTTDRGTPIVAVALQESAGVMIREGSANTFAACGLTGEDVRVLEIQRYQKRRYLWAGVYARGLEGGGCHRRELELGSEPGWTPFVTSWKGGSCRSLAFSGARVLAGTYRGGALWLDTDRSNAAWQAPDLRSGLPVESELKLFTQINAVATPADESSSGYLALVCGPAGVYRAAENLNSYENCSQTEFKELVSVPATWLLCSGTHEIEVVVQGEDERD